MSKVFYVRFPDGSYWTGKMASNISAPDYNHAHSFSTLLAAQTAFRKYVIYNTKLVEIERPCTAIIEEHDVFVVKNDVEIPFDITTALVSYVIGHFNLHFRRTRRWGGNKTSGNIEWVNSLFAINSALGKRLLDITHVALVHANDCSSVREIYPHRTVIKPTNHFGTWAFGCLNEGEVGMIRLACSEKFAYVDLTEFWTSFHERFPEVGRGD